jgi:hypothetical protein
MTDQEDRAVDLGNDALEARAIASAETAQRIWRSDNRDVFAE